MAGTLTLLAMACFAHAQSPLPDDFKPVADGPVFALAVQPDGKVLLGGDFTMLAGRSRARIGRVSADGSVDSAFDVGSGANGRVTCLALQSDGKVIVGGNFTVFNGRIRNYVARLNPDGSLDNSFDPGASAVVNVLAVQADGKILVGGNFGSLGGQPRSFLGRLNEDGTVDPSCDVSLNGPVSTMAVQGNGEIVMGGGFTLAAGVPRCRLARLTQNALLDEHFNPGADNSVLCLAAQSDGSLWVGGSFTNLGGQPCNRLGRLSPDGSLLNPAAFGANSTVYSLGLLANGKVIAGGSFSSLGGLARNRIGRLNADGSGDATFNPGGGNLNPGVNGTAYGVAIQSDGRILVAGSFSILAGQSRGNLGRLLNAEPIVDQLESIGADIIWWRGGSAPEIWQSKFEFSTNQTDWASLGWGWVDGGAWRLSGVSLPEGEFNLRALGFASAGYQGGSVSIVETVTGAPILRAQPASRTNNFGTAGLFQISAVGSSPLTYQWWKGNQPLANGGKISGAGTPTLTVSNLAGLVGGEYWAVVSNSFASTTSSIAVLTVLDPLITSQPSSQTRNVGDTASFGVSASGSTPLCYQWRYEGTDLIGKTSSTLSMPSVQGVNRGMYDVVVSNLYGVITSTPAFLTVSVSAFDALAPSVNHDVYAVSIQPDKKIVVGGRFTSFAGASRQYLARLNADGTLDTSFAPAANNAVFAVAIQEDGRIVVAGWFTTLAGKARNYIGRLHQDGSLDESFDPSATGGTEYPGVYSVILQADGRLVVGGDFRSLGGGSCTNLGRLNPDGSVDNSFMGYADSIVYPLALQPDGKIVVGGAFTNLSGSACSRLGRVLNDGRFDSGFHSSANDIPLAIAIQGDGGILVGGGFTNLAGETCNGIGRLNQDGRWDASFYPVSGNPALADGVSGRVRTQVLHADGRVLLGGYFFSLAGLPRQDIARLTASGDVDTSFGPSASAEVFAITVQEDGNILVGGRSILKRLTNSESATSSLTLTNSTLKWVCHGAGPDFWRTSFFMSTNGSEWVLLGPGQRDSDGWQFDEMTLPEGATYLARGYVTGGRYGCSSWFVETTGGPLCIGRQPLSRTNNPGTRASFDVAAGGAPPLRYQWYRNGAKLSNDGVFSGVQTPLLILNSVNTAHAASYWVVVSNVTGMVTSRVATLSVANPYITTQPSSRTNNAGTLATFSAQAGGTTSPTYQWYHDGVILTNGDGVSGATNSTLTLSNVFGADAGSYWVAVSNISGALASTVVGLTVLDPIIVSGPASKTVNVGGSTSLAVSAMGTAPLCYQWRKNGQALEEMTGAQLTLTNSQLEDIGEYDVLVSSDYGTVTSAPVVLSVNVALPDSFNPTADGTVYSMAIEANGRILVGGAFANLAGAGLQRLGRLNADGSPDNTFISGADGNISSLSAHPNGRIVVSGGFNSLAGEPRRALGRLHATGDLDTGFQPPSFNNSVYSTVFDAADRILVAGSFNSVMGLQRERIMRLGYDGTLDLTFTPVIGSFITAMLPQSDGGIYIAGSFVLVNGQPRSKVVRLRWDGTLDTTFDPGESISTNGFVYAIALQADEKVLVAGIFTAADGQTNLARLHPDGTLDSSFRATANGVVYSLVLRVDGRILVAGDFTELGGLPRRRLGQLHTDGSTDRTFDPGADATVYSVLVQADGKVVVAGNFTELGGQPRLRMGRLNSNESATQAVSVLGNDVVWSFGGAGPEVQRVTFERSANGVDWVLLGPASRVAGGWSCTTEPLPPGIVIRACGYGSGGYWGGSSWVLESHSDSTEQQPVILLNDGRFGIHSNHLGFTVVAPAAQRAILEISTNLSEWTPVWTNPTEGGAAYFQDTETIVHPQRFYRARLVP
jgi:uncharacterized delta-60 repeat protein